MSDWDDFRRWQAAPKKAPPKDGIAIGKVGETWWGQRSIEALERMAGYGQRLARGKTYARAGRTSGLTVKGGQVTAKVTGTQVYAVSMRLRALPDATWARVTEALAAKAQFAAGLLAGEMPRDIEAVFQACGAPLFPASRGDLATDCSCPDSANPCKHVAATHFVLGDALERDPFLLFELRGRTRDQVLDALRAARTGASAETRAGAKSAAQAGAKSAARAGAKSETRAGAKSAAQAGAGQASAAEAVPTVSLEGIDAAAYDAPRGALPTLRLSFDAPAAEGAVLRQLGAPAGWRGAPPAEVLLPAVRAAAEAARRIALAESAPSPAAGPADERRPPHASAAAAEPRRSRDPSPDPTSTRRQRASAVTGGR